MVIDTIISECRNAIIARKPIIVLRTDEIEIIRDIIKSDKLVVRLSKDTREGHQDPPAIPTRYLDPNSVPDVFKTGNNDLDTDFNIRYFSSKFDYPEESKTTHVPQLFLFRKFPVGDSIDRFINDYYKNGADNTAVADIVLVFGTKVNSTRQTDSSSDIPEEYSQYCKIIDEPYPDRNEIKKLLHESELNTYIKDFDSAYDDDGKDKYSYEDRLTDAFIGMRLYQIKRIIESIAILPSQKSTGKIIRNPEETFDEIKKHKGQILKASGQLELYETVADTMGGMGAFSDWMDREEHSIRRANSVLQETGAGLPKGILLCGIPGCGKSMAVNAFASRMHLQVIKFNIGHLLGKYVGESEHNMEAALKLAEAMAPVVLFIDELDKSFSDAASSSSDGAGYFKRMFGNFLSWMQECKKMCFIFATANDISMLPKEFFRSGRFEVLFSVFMSTATENRDILKKQMESANSNSQKLKFIEYCFDDDYLLGIINEVFGYNKRFVTGADINKIVNMSLRRLWKEKTNGNIITKDEWRDQIVESLSLPETKVYGDSNDNLDSIAMCYIRMLRNNFTNVSLNPMFTNYAVTVEKNSEEKPIFKVSFKKNPDTEKNIYDKNLMEELITRINTLAPDYEKQEFYRKTSK